MKVGRIEFTPHWAATLVTMPLLALLVSLGLWQMGRADEKAAQLTQSAVLAEQPPIELSNIEANKVPPRYTRISATGNYEAARQFVLDNRTHLGQAGYYILTPFLLRDGSAVLVNRGWLPAGMDRSVLPDLSITAGGGPTTIRGKVNHPSEQQMILGPAGYAAAQWPRLIQRIELDSSAQALAMKLRDFTVRLDPGEPDGYTREWPVHYGISPERHHAYAFQWFSLATALLIIYIVVNLRRHPRP